VAIPGDLDAARLALLGLRDPYLEHAVVEGGADLVGVDAVGQRQRAAEPAERALEPEEALLLALVLVLALSRDGQRAVVDSIATSSCFMPGRSAFSRYWSSVSTRSICGTQVRDDEAAGDSQSELNSRENSVETGSGRTRTLIAVTS
jgi:hypothetical protein